MSEADTHHGLQCIAIIGMAGRFPGAANLNEFWRNLVDGVESITFFSDKELEAAGIDPAVIGAPTYVKASGALQGVELFDASFFGFSPREAEIMDPQYRLFLETSWEALERSGYVPDTYQGVIGVYGGMNMSTYLLNNLLTNREVMESEGALQIRILNDKDFLASLTAYKLNLKGPSVTVQAACSTSLVATHLACQSLLNYQCDMALAGGVSVNAPTKFGYYSKEGVFSPDGHCRAFDSRAAGTVVGSGVGVVVLKRLDDALADGDHIHAVIKGSAINNDGSSKAGYTAPSINGQAEVIAMAQALADVEPETITYIEAHGTATPLGDPIEVAALSQVFRASVNANRFCRIGSVKTNIGHLDAAAGVAGIIKTALALERKKLPASLHFEKPNAAIDFENSPFYVNSATVNWEAGATPRRAGISAFAVGGVNAHLIVEQAPDVEPSGPSRSLQIILFSARTESALEQATDQLARHFKENPNQNFADAAYTLQVGRKHFNHRRALVCRDVGEAIAALETRDAKRVMTFVRRTERQRVTLMFPGLGNQYVDMGLELYQFESTFRRQVDHCCELLEPLLGLNLRDSIYPDVNKEMALKRNPHGDVTPTGSSIDLRRMLRRDQETDERNERLNETYLAQPALFVIEYSLAKLLMEWGIRPQAMIGYSIGEYVAGCLAGVMSLEDALRLVTKRAQLIQALPRGAMLAVPLSEDEAAPLLNDRLSLSAINGPSISIISGDPDSVAELERRLALKGLACRHLQTTHAFHSKMMEPIRHSLARFVSSIKLEPPKIPYLSNVTGTWITGEQATDPNYWAKHLCLPVRFAECLSECLKAPDNILVELGPGQALSSWATQHPDNAGANGVILSSMPHSYDRQSDLAFFFSTLGKLWLAGTPVDWEKFHAGERRHRAPLPTYPFERKRYWIEPQPRIHETHEMVITQTSLSKKMDVADWFYIPVWKQSRLLDGELSGRNNWLVFMDGCGIGAQLIERLRRAGQKVIVVNAGERLSRTDDGVYMINPSSPDDYIGLLNDLRSLGLIPSIVVHLWSVGPDDRTGSRVEVSERWGRRGFFSLLCFAQAWGNLNTSDLLHIAVVSNGAHQVTGEEELLPEKAVVLGAGKVIPQEYPTVTCVCIDVSSPRQGSPLSAGQFELLWSELTAKPSEQVVAYRGNQRWIRAFEPIRLERPAVDKTRLRERGVYFITGGLGGIGMTLAEFLARSLRARLVLAGRSEFPPKDQWNTWLATHEESEVVSEKIRKLQELESYGAESLVLKVNVTNLADMRRAVETTIQRFGAIHGVIHAAGVSPGGMIQMKAAEAAMSVLDPKVKGALVLDEVLGDYPLDFLLLCSSLVSIVGGLGMVDHSGANAFLDSFAHYRNLNPDTPTISVNWDTWLEVGQAAFAELSGGLKGILQNGNGERIGHPLVEKRLTATTTEDTFLTEFCTAKHWALDEHRIMNKGVLPGVAYLEMARKAFEAHAKGNDIVIDNAVFIRPLAVNDGEKQEVYITIKRDGDRFQFSIAGKSASDGREMYEYAKGSIYHRPPDPPPAHRIDEIIQRCEEGAAVSAQKNSDDDAKEKYVTFGKRWQNLYKMVYIGKNEALAEVELPGEFSGDLDTFILHPSLMDAATGFVQIADNGFYLPMSYGKVRIRRPLQRRIYSYIELKDPAFSGRETIACDVLIMDERGNELVEIEDFIIRRVKNVAGLGALSAPSIRQTRNGSEPVSELQKREPGQAAEVRPKVGILPGEGAEAFGRILSTSMRIPQVLVSTMDMQALLKQASAVNRSVILDEIVKLQSQRPRHARPNISTQYVAPATTLEQELVTLWEDTLNVDRAGIYDNFFEIGGDSLLATQLIARLSESFRINLSLRALFESPTVADLAVAILQKQAEGAIVDPVAQAPSEIRRPITRQNSTLDTFPLSYAQQRLWFIEQLAPGSFAYNIPSAVRLTGRIDVNALGRSLNEIVRRHGSLRTIFTMIDERPVQVISPNGDIPLQTINLTDRPSAEREAGAKRFIDEEVRRPFDLTRGPLLRVTLIRIDDLNHILVWVIHHIVSDKISQDIFVQELVTLYSAFSTGKASPLPEAPIQYADFAHWQLQWLQGEVLESQLAYWKRNLAGAASSLQLPTDRPRPPVQTFNGSKYSARFSRELADDLERMGQREGCTMFMVLLAAFKTLIYCYTNQQDLSIGTTISGRYRTETEGLIGFFVNTLVLRTEIRGDISFSEALSRIREVTLGAETHQYVPFEKVVEEMQAPRDPSRHPMFQIIFNLQSAPPPSLGLPELSVTPLEADNGTVKFDMAIFMAKAPEGLFGLFFYNTDLFAALTIERMAEDYGTLLSIVAAKPEARLGELQEALSQEKRRRRADRLGSLKKSNLEKLKTSRRKNADNGDKEQSR